MSNYSKSFRPGEGQKSKVKKLTREMGLRRHRFIRQFCVADATSAPQLGKPSVIFYLPTAAWCTTDFPYNEAVRNLEQHPESDASLVELFAKAMPPTLEEAFSRLAEIEGSKESVLQSALESFKISRFRFVRTFCIADVSGFVGPAPTLVFFVPTSRFIPYKLPFEEAIRWIEGHPEKDLALAFDIQEDACQEIFAEIRKGASAERTLPLLKQLCGGDAKAALQLFFSFTGIASRYEFIRDFCVAELKSEGLAGTVVYYVPELAFDSSGTSYELTVHALHERPEDDLNLIEKLSTGEVRGTSDYDRKVAAHHEGLKRLERLCKDCNNDVHGILRLGEFPRHQFVKQFCVVDVEGLKVHAPTMVMLSATGQWMLCDASYEDTVLALGEDLGSEVLARLENQLRTWSQEDRRYRTFGFKSRDA